MPYQLNAVTLATFVILLTACSHKDNANAPATAPASSVASIDAADLAIDHAGNIIASAPAQPTTPAVTAAPAPAEPLPFIGKKFFNFMGGTGTEQSITIKKNGHTVIQLCGDPATGGTCEVEYKGAFKNPIMLKNGEGWLIKDNKIYSLEHGEIAKGCSGDDQADCSSELD